MTFIPEEDLPVAKETVVVHDEALGIDRRVLEGKPVPPDLVEAYEKATGAKRPSRAKKDE